jgi:hypothetical protein
MMRHFLLTNLFFAAMTINVGVPARLAAVAPPNKDIAVADIPDKTRLLKAELLGKYIFFHDDEKMASGEPCFYVYRYSEDITGQPEIKPENLVVSFHCQPVERPKVNQPVLTYGVVRNGLFELREIQFAGSLEGHRVP